MKNINVITKLGSKFAIELKSLEPKDIDAIMNQIEQWEFTVTDEEINFKKQHRTDMYNLEDELIAVLIEEKRKI